MVARETRNATVSAPGLNVPVAEVHTGLERSVLRRAPAVSHKGGDSSAICTLGSGGLVSMTTLRGRGWVRTRTQVWAPGRWFLNTIWSSPGKVALRAGRELGGLHWVPGVLRDGGVSVSERKVTQPRGWWQAHASRPCC